MPPLLRAAIALLLAGFLAGRLAFWRPQLALRRLDIGVMLLGYCGIVLQLLVVFSEGAALTAWVGNVSMHLFSFGTMGLIIPAMILRISKGHTGRQVSFESIDKLVLWIMLAAFALRVVAPQIAPGRYLLWVELAAVSWSTGFALLAWRVVPYLFAPRIDGREH